MAPERVSAEHEQAGQIPQAQSQAAAPTLVVTRDHGSLARALRSGAPISNRAVAQMVMRDAGYGYEFADDPLAAGGFGPSDATIRVKPGAVRSTLIGPRVPAQTTAPPAPAPAVAPAAPATPGDRIRDDFVKILRSYEGATEGDSRFSAIASPGRLETARRAAGGENRTHTTCIDFATVMLTTLSDHLTKNKLGKIVKKSGLVLTPMTAASQSSFVKAPSAKRPKRGDLYVLHSVKPGKSPGDKPVVGAFSHTGFVLSVTDNHDGTETWETIDGGQSGKTWYTDQTVTEKEVVNKKGETVKVKTYSGGKKHNKGGAEQILVTPRKYRVAENMITGEKTQGGADRWVLGWLDLDQLVEPAPAKP